MIELKINESKQKKFKQKNSIIDIWQGPKISFYINLLNANLIKWSKTLKQFDGSLPANCLSVFDHSVALGLKGLRF